MAIIALTFLPTFDLFCMVGKISILTVSLRLAAVFCFLLVGALNAQRPFGGAHRRNPEPPVASRPGVVNERSVDSSPQSRQPPPVKKPSGWDTFNDKLFGEPKRRNLSGNTVNRNMDGRVRGVVDYELPNQQRGIVPAAGAQVVGQANAFQRAPPQRPSSTMPALLIFVMIIIVAVVIVWMEANYGFLEELFRVVSPDENSSVEERLDRYSGVSSSRRHGKKRKRKARKGKQDSNDEDSDDDEDEEDDDENGYRKKRKHRVKSKRHRKSSASSKSSTSKSSKSPKKRKRGKKDDEQSDDTSSDTHSSKRSRRSKATSKRKSRSRRSSP